MLQIGAYLPRDHTTSEKIILSRYIKYDKRERSYSRGEGKGSQQVHWV